MDLQSELVTENGSVHTPANNSGLPSASAISIPVSASIVCLMCLNILLGIPANLIVCFAVYKIKSLRTSMNALVVNLGMADLISCAISSPLLAACLLQNSMRHMALCRLFDFAHVLGGTVQLLSMACISFERYQAISRPFEIEERLKRIRVSLLVTWIVGIICAGVSVAMVENPIMILCTSRADVVILSCYIFGVYVFFPLGCIIVVTVFLFYAKIIYLVNKHVKDTEMNLKRRTMKRKSNRVAPFPHQIGNIQTRVDGQHGSVNTLNVNTVTKAKSMAGASTQKNISQQNKMSALDHSRRSVAPETGNKQYAPQVSIIGEEPNSAQRPSQNDAIVGAFKSWTPSNHKHELRRRSSTIQIFTERISVENDNSTTSTYLDGKRRTKSDSDVSRDEMNVSISYRYSFDASIFSNSAYSGRSAGEVDIFTLHTANVPDIGLSDNPPQGRMPLNTTIIVPAKTETTEPVSGMMSPDDQRQVDSSRNLTNIVEKTDESSPNIPSGSATMATSQNKDVKSIPKRREALVEIHAMDGSMIKAHVSGPEIHGSICVMDPSNRERGKRRVELKTAKRTAVVIVTFVACWLPYWAVILASVGVFRTKMNVNIWFNVYIITLAVAVLAALMNPIVYGLINNHFRSGIVRMLKRCNK